MFKSKNLIVLVGNGFDLAHGLSTSYSDFSNYHLDNFIVPEWQELKSGKKKDSHIFNQKTIAEIQNENGPYGSRSLWNSKISPSTEIKELLREQKKDFHLMLKNKLLGKLYSEEKENWFNVEKVYFDELVQLTKDIKNSSPSETRKIVTQHNRELDYIKSALREFLYHVKPEFDDKIGAFFKNNLLNRGFQNIYFLVFNYTSTLDLYTYGFKNLNTIAVNHIHGTLDERIIFGYGDDQSGEYQELRDYGMDELLDGFKTFFYAENNKYTEIYDNAINFYSDYEVLNLGHSLGLTDKTLLEEILNSKKCKRLHLVKRSDIEIVGKKIRSFRTLYMAASRIISDDKRLRRLVVNYENALSFP